MRATVVLAVLLVLGLTAPAAHAERWSAPDPRGDVTRTVVDLTPVPEGQPCPEPVSAQVGSDNQRDLRRLVVDHGPRAVTITMAMGRVAARSAATSWDVRLRTNRTDYELRLDRLRRDGPLEASLQVAPDYPEPEEVQGCGFFVATTGVDCDGLAVRADARTDRVRVTVPRECLRQPRWVSVGASVQATRGSLEEGSLAVLLDFWGPPGSAFADFQPPYGPKVRR